MSISYSSVDKFYLFTVSGLFVPFLCLYSPIVPCPYKLAFVLSFHFTQPEHQIQYTLSLMNMATPSTRDDNKMDQALSEPQHSRIILAAPGSASASHQHEFIHWYDRPTQRFRIELSEAAEVRQLQERDKLLHRVNLSPFSPTTEKEFEDWVDSAAQITSRHRLGMTLFQEAWMSVSSFVYAQTIGDVFEATGHEDLVRQVALKMFPVSHYVLDVENALKQGERQASVLMAEHHCRNLLARYVRLCNRREWECSITQSRFIESMITSLPDSIERDVRRHFQQNNRQLVEILKYAYHLECENSHIQSSTATRVLPIHNNPLMEDVEQPQETRGPKKRQPTGTCWACGFTGHWRRDCKHKNDRCEKCRIIGHCSAACKKFVEKDQSGRIKTRVSADPKGITLETKTDNKAVDKMQSASNVLELLKKAAQQRSATSKKRREEKKVETNWKPKRRPVEHPVNHVDAESNSSSSSDNEIEDELVEQIASMISEAHLLTVKGDGSQSVVWCEIIVNGVKIECVADSGAGHSVCSPITAAKLGLKLTADKHRFRGLGKSEGVSCDPVQITLLPFDRVAAVTFAVVPQNDFDTVICVKDMAKFNIVIDPVTCCLIDRNSFVQVNQVSEAPVVQSEGTVTGVVDGESDEQLLEKARKFYGSKTEHLDPDRREELWKLFVEFRDCWLRPASGQFSGFKGSFQVHGPPHRAKLRPLTPPMKAEMDQQLDDLLKHQLIRPSKSPWAAFPVFAQKKNGKWRMALNYTKLNSQMKPDAYPLPRLWDLVQEAAHYQYYTVIDCNWGFWNIEIEEESREYTAIITDRGQFEFNVLPFGIRNSPAIFQRAMDFTFQELRKEGLWWYVDDIVNFHNHWSDHIKSIYNVLRLGRKSKIYFNFYKIIFAEPSAEILGHIVSFHGIEASDRKVEDLRKSRKPRNKDELRSFLGLATYVSKFIPSYSEIASPLYDLLSHRVLFNWTDECNNAFELLKDALCDKVMLTAPNGLTPFIIACDASNYGIGSAIFQEWNGDLALIEFAARRLTPAERKWDTREKEAFAIKWSVQRFADYVRGTRFFVITDHESLRWMENATEGKVQRWSLYLQQFMMTLLHIQGEFNVVADWLSRSVDDDEDHDEIIDAISTPLFVLDADHRHASSVSSTSAKSLSVRSPYVPTVLDFQICYDSIPVNEKRMLYLAPDGMYYHVRTNKLYIPMTLRDCLLHWFHVSKFGGHCGVNKTARRMSKWVWWPHMSQDVQKYVRQCLICIRSGTPQPVRTLHSILTKPLPFQIVSVDFIVDVEWQGIKFDSLIIVDHATRFMVGFVCIKDSEHAAKGFRERWCSIFQAPNVVLSDRGSEFLKFFNSYVVEGLLSYHMFTSAYYPQGNAINEASHKAINRVLTSCSQIGNSPFDEALESAVAVHNATPHHALGISPFSAVFGFEPTLPGWQKYRNQHDSSLRHLRRQEVRAQAVLKAQLDREDYRLSHATEFNEGDWVVYFLSTYEKSVSNNDVSVKYSAEWSLPSRVIKVHSTTLDVCPWGSVNIERQVPKVQIRKLDGQVPPSLQQLNLKVLEYCNPRAVRPKFINKQQFPTSVTWKELLDSKSSTVRKHPRLE